MQAARTEAVGRGNGHARLRDASSGTEDQKLGELMSAISRDTSLLVDQELELFKREMDARITRVEKQGAMLGAGSLVAYVGVLALTAALILGLATTMSGWIAALIVGVAYAAIGGAMVVRGKRKLAEAELTPKKTIQSVKTDAWTLKEAAR